MYFKKPLRLCLTLPSANPSTLQLMWETPFQVGHNPMLGYKGARVTENIDLTNAKNLHHHFADPIFSKYFFLVMVLLSCFLLYSLCTRISLPPSLPNRYILFLMIEDTALVV